MNYQNSLPTSAQTIIKCFVNSMAYRKPVDSHELKGTQVIKGRKLLLFSINQYHPPNF